MSIRNETEMPKSNRARRELKSIVDGDKPSYVRNLFDSIAEDYDRMNWVMTGGLLALWHRAFMKATALADGQTALDVCCGTGDLSFLMAKRVGTGGRVVGLDFSEHMLSVARRRLQQSQEAKGAQAPITWRQGDALSLPFPDGAGDRGFHCTTMGFALRNVNNVESAVQEMARVTRTGGRVVCLEVSRPDNLVLRIGFNLYFYNIVPLLGKAVEKGLSGKLSRLRPYTYLPYSLEHLPPPDNILQMMRESGLSRVVRRPLTGGAVSLYIGTKSA